MIISPHKSMAFNYRSYNSLIKAVTRNANRYIGYDVIVGIPKSGIVPAVALANTLGLPFATLPSMVRGENPSHGFRPIRPFPGWSNARILIVDDSVNNGNAMRRARGILADQNLKANSMAVYATSQGVKHVDSFLELLEHPRAFEWNLLNNSLSKQACFDLDGVLCIDPSNEEKSDEKSYLHFIENAEPFIIPKKRIGHIVTSRLEKYRTATERWLENQGVIYDKLIMMQHFDAETRQRFSLHAIFKAQILKETGALYFVESSPVQASVIARLAERPCFCVADMNMYMPRYSTDCEWVEKIDGVSHKPNSDLAVSRVFRKLICILSKLKRKLFSNK